MEKFFGHGVKLRIYFRTAAWMILLFTLLNYLCRNWFGLCFSEGPITSLIDALYFTIISLTTVGYGDIAPTKELGKIIISLENMLGFGMFGFLISMLYRRIAP